MDRRIQKSKQAIMDSLIKLMFEKDFESITINEIAETANVNRGTVYLHYVDKFDLLDQCIDAHLKQLVESCIPEEDIASTSKAAMLRTFEYLEKDSFFYSTMMTNKGISAFRNRVMTTMEHILGKQMDLIDLDKDLNKEITLQFLASAFTGVLEWWIIHSQPYPASVMVEQFWLLLERIQHGFTKISTTGQHS